MGLFDTIREKAAELLSGVTEKAGDLADGLPGDLGDGLPGAETLNDLSQSATDAASEATEAATDAAGSVTDATDTVTGSFTDATGEPPKSTPNV